MIKAFRRMLKRFVLIELALIIFLVVGNLWGGYNTYNQVKEDQYYFYGHDVSSDMFWGVVWVFAMMFALFGIPFGIILYSAFGLGWYDPEEEENGKD